MEENVGEQSSHGGSLSGRKFFPTWHKRGNPTGSQASVSACRSSRDSTFSQIREECLLAGWGGEGASQEQTPGEHPSTLRDRLEGNRAGQERSQMLGPSCSCCHLEAKSWAFTLLPRHCGWALVALPSSPSSSSQLMTEEFGCPLQAVSRGLDDADPRLVGW